MLGLAQRTDIGAAPPAELARIMSPDTLFTVYRTRMPGAPQAPADLPLQQISYMAAALAAEPFCDALLFNTAGDYGLAAVKSAVSIPVVGAGEASLRLAPSLGRRFSIVTVWPKSLNFIPLNILREYGLEEACASIRNVGVEAELATLGQPDGYVARMQAGADEIMARIVTECHRAISDDAAEVVVLGCTCMSPIAEQISARCDFPVINPLAAGLKMAESLATMRLSSSRVLQPPIRPERAERVRMMVHAVATIPQDECQVCVFAAAAE
jgi:allantoin racemase